MTLQDAGLVCFSMAVGANTSGLMIDAALYTIQLPTVSHFAQHNAWFAAFVIGLNILGTAGLALHFSIFNGNP